MLKFGIRDAYVVLGWVIYYSPGRDANRQRNRDLTMVAVWVQVHPGYPVSYYY